jgi:hypothetical protein
MDFYGSSDLLRLSRGLTREDAVLFPVSVDGRVVKFIPSAGNHYMGGYDNHEYAIDTLDRLLLRFTGKPLKEFLNSKFTYLGAGGWPEIVRSSSSDKENGYKLRDQCYAVMRALENGLASDWTSPKTPPGISVDEYARTEKAFAESERHITPYIAPSRPASLAEYPVTLDNAYEKKTFDEHSDNESEALRNISFIKSKRDGRRKIKVTKVRRTDCKIKGGKSIRRTAIRS